MSLVAAQVWEANVQVHRRGLELIRPGARCRDIAAELNDLFASLGLLQYRCGQGKIDIYIKVCVVLCCMVSGHSAMVTALVC